MNPLSINLSSTNFVDTYWHFMETKPNKSDV